MWPSLHSASFIITTGSTSEGLGSLRPEDGEATIFCIQALPTPFDNAFRQLDYFSHVEGIDALESWISWIRNWKHCSLISFQGHSYLVSELKFLKKEYFL